MKLAYKLSPYIGEKKHSYLSCNSTVRMQGQWKVLCYPVLWDEEMLQPGFFFACQLTDPSKYLRQFTFFLFETSKGNNFLL